MPKALVVDLDKCTGCRSCELACSFKHHGEFNPAKSAIHVSIFADKAFYVPVVCYQCNKPFCKEVCPTGALYASEANGAFVVKVDTEKCVGCKMCMLACPFGSITVQDDGFAQKCDLCGGEPECAVFCVPGAIEFKDMEESSLKKTRATAEKFYQQKEDSQ
ncbi:MAG: 4Fe-4S dicluster domain-containing protein [Desulfobacterales bacterium]|nr:4Fe-4S dicluster domain-containing protein [Desulfobacterales bacterium]